MLAELKSRNVGESCRPKGNEQKPGETSFCRIGMQGEIVGVSLDWNTRYR